MAAVETIEGDETINVSDVVGSKKSANLTDDVMVVQGLLAFIYSFPAFAQKSIPIPVPTGTFDKHTGDLILDYQHRSNLLNVRNHSRLRVLEDGRVSPARGKSEWGHNMLWTIISMNFQGGLFAAATGETSLLAALLKRFPQ